MIIGILAIQGGFREHSDILNQHGVDTVNIRTQNHLNDNLDGIILPGGESTVMGKLLRELNMLGLLRQKINEGMPVLGTCAGLILLAKNIEGTNESHLGLMNITVKRNGYGRQLGSFSTTAPLNNEKEVPMVFIRAPYITKTEKEVEILARANGKIVAAREKNMLVTTFHPELTSDFTTHKLFLDMVKSG